MTTSLGKHAAAAGGGQPVSQHVVPSVIAGTQVGNAGACMPPVNGLAPHRRGRDPQWQPARPAIRLDLACPHPSCGLQATTYPAFTSTTASQDVLRRRMVAEGKARLLALLEALR